MNRMTTSIWKGPFRYHLQTMLRSAGVMFLVIILVQVVLIALINKVDPEANSVNTSQEMAVTIFCFVFGCCMWKENFHFAMASGISRRKIYLCMLLSLFVLSVVIAPVTLLMNLFFGLFSNSRTLFFLIYGELQNISSPFSSFPFMMQGVLLEIALSLACAYAGLFLGCLFYVISKWLRVTLAILIPVSLFAGLPSLLMLIPVETLKPFGDFVASIFFVPWKLTLLLLVLAVLFALLTWIPAHHAALMRNPQPSSANSF